MIVIDASVLANVVGDDGPAGRAARTRIAAGLAMVRAGPRRRRDRLRASRPLALLVTSPRGGFDPPSRIFSALPIVRFPVGPLMIRAYELRSNVTPYDATYVALAEGLSLPAGVGPTVARPEHPASTAPSTSWCSDRWTSGTSTGPRLGFAPMSALKSHTRGLDRRLGQRW